jgi:anaerobic selenocysteine-containing dehydrogenase
MHARHPLPIYAPIPDHHRDGNGDRLIMISFKWSVHNAHRTMQSKWLCEIAHSNPAWLHPETARRFGLAEGDWAEVTSYRPKDSFVPHDDGSVMGRMKVPAHITEGVHPRVIAISHNNVRQHGGLVATGKPKRAGLEGLGTSGDPGECQDSCRVVGGQLLRSVTPWSGLRTTVVIGVQSRV